MKQGTADTHESHGSSVGIATGYGLDDRRVGVRVPVECYFLHVIQNIFGGRIASYKMVMKCVTGAYFHGVKRPRREADYSSLTSD
jgi:hypothetical protein